VHAARLKIPVQGHDIQHSEIVNKNHIIFLSIEVNSNEPIGESCRRPKKFTKPKKDLY
jgi:hypothetical protein